MHIVSFVGEMATGKTAISNILAIENNGVVLSFASPLKRVATDVYGMKEKDRILLQTLGEAMRSVRSSVFLDYTRKEIHDAVESGKNVYVDDCRYTNELEMLEELGSKIIRLRSSELTRHNRLKQNGLQFTGTTHASETEMDGFDENEFDMILYNDNDVTLDRAVGLVNSIL
jgi:hypothetical protein